MKLDNLKKYFSLIALLMAVAFTASAQSSEETENTKNADEATEASDVSQDTIITEATAIEDVVLTTDDMYYSEAAAEQEEDENTDEYATGSFGDLTEREGITKETPITISPNPMITSATIRFYNPEKDAVTLDIYDNIGRIILHITNLQDYEYNIDKDVIPEGIYYVKIKKKTGGDDDDDDDDRNDLLFRGDKPHSDVLIYTTKLVVN